jgi:hypothetical protein
MPIKKTILTDAERAKRIREIAREIGTDNDPESLERAFKKVVARHKPIPDAPRPFDKKVPKIKDRSSAKRGTS